MKDPLNYTYDGIERELNLLEVHLKEAPEGDEAFCKDCIDKHISTARGFALEGPGFTDDKEEQKRFLDVEKQLREIKGMDYKKNGIEYAQKIRQIRKFLIEECPNCKTLSKREIEDLTKDLNNTSTSDYYKLNKNPKKMVTYTELGMMNAGQFAAEGVRYLVETQASMAPYEKYITIGGGIGLQALALFLLKKQKTIQTLSLVAGSNLLANGVIKLVKGATAPTAALRVVANQGNAVNQGGYAGKAFSYAPTYGGQTFAGKVTAQNIPSRYARAGILYGAQAFEAPEHADLIRVD